VPVPLKKALRFRAHVEDADDFDRIGEDSVKDQIVVADEIAEISRDVRSRMAEMGMVGKAVDPRIEHVEQAVGGRRVIVGDVLPNGDEILARLVGG
jgi:hypothetical protein